MTKFIQEKWISHERNEDSLKQENNAIQVKQNHQDMQSKFY